MIVLRQDFKMDLRQLFDRITFSDHFIIFFIIYFLIKTFDNICNELS